MSKFFEVKKLVDKNKEIDAAACVKFVSNLVKDSEFKYKVEEIITECHQQTSKHADIFQRDSEIPKKKCMVKYNYMADCVRLKMFAVRF